MTAIKIPFIGYYVDRTVTALYSFTTFTFTNASTTGSSGPSLATLLASYDTVTNSWLNDTAFFNATGGIQEWTVPETGNYSFEVGGAVGGQGWTSGNANNRGGYPALLTGTVSLTAGNVIKILVGQPGTNSTGTSSCSLSPGGGGGGTFVFNDTTSELLFAAGGGGGGATAFVFEGSDLQQDASLTTSGRDSEGSSGVVAGGTGGSGGAAGTGCVTGAAGGGGYSGSGSSTASAPGGTAFTSGGSGGDGSFKDGGFGGGGSSHQYTGGGGGGYSGGGGGGLPACTCNSLRAGGGGGSFIIGSATSTSSVITSNSTKYSQVTVTKV